MPSKSRKKPDAKSPPHSTEPARTEARYSLTHVGLALTVLFALVGGAWCLSQSAEKLNAVSASITEVKTDVRQGAVTQDRTSNELGDVAGRVGAIETTVAFGLVAASPTAAQRKVITGVAGIIDRSFSGRATYCPGDHRYDPAEKILAVAVGLGSSGALPCGTRVQITRSRSDGSLLSIETDVADQFPDASDDLSAPTARKFNLSEGAAQALEIDGVAVVTVEAIVPE